MRALIPVLVFALSLSAAEHRPAGVTNVAGIEGVAGFNDGPVGQATFNRPTWLDIVVGDGPFDHALSGDIFVIDRENDVIRRISNGRVTTLTLSTFPGQGDGKFDFGGPFGGGILIEPQFAGCGSGVYDRGMFVSSTGSRQVAHVSPYGFLAARDDVWPYLDFYNPFVAPAGIARSWHYPNFERVYDRSLYVADSANHTIVRFGFTWSFEACPQHKFPSVFAGEEGVAGSRDGQGTSAQFNSPRGIVGAPDGSVYVADTGNHIIRRITADGNVTTVAGIAGLAGDVDGEARLALLNTPSGIDVNARGEVFIADTGNASVRMLGLDGRLTTIARLPGGPVGLKLAPDGSIVIADPANSVIRRIVFFGQGRPRAVR